MKLPKSRTDKVAVQRLNNEILIYDLITDKAFCLNETLAIVYQSCDGATTFEELKRKHKFSDDIIFLALDELQKENLLAGNYESKFAGVSRREVIRRAGLSSMVALPILAGLVAPKAAHAASNCVDQNQNCIQDDFKQSNCCPSFRCSLNSANTCQPCRASGVGYYQAFANVDQATCSARVERNFCCDPASTPTVDGTNCVCG